MPIIVKSHFTNPDGETIHTVREFSDCVITPDQGAPIKRRAKLQAQFYVDARTQAGAIIDEIQEH